MSTPTTSTIAALLDPGAVDCLIRTATDLWRGRNDEDLSAYQRDVLIRACILLDSLDQGRATAAGPEGTVPVPVWVLIRWDQRTPREVSVHADADAAYAELAPHVRSSWGNVWNWYDDAPSSPPADHQEAVELYYGPERSREDEGYSLYQSSIDLRI